MAINFKSEEFLDLSKSEKKETIVSEFVHCKNDFEYYLNEYAYVKHPNQHIIKMVPFDFQLDIAIPISKALVHGRNKKTIEQLKEYNQKFDYEKWRKEYLEENLDLYNSVPQELHDYYNAYIMHPEYTKKLDAIILKSRQTGLSTIFQQLCLWYANFKPYTSSMVISKSDRDASKFLGDIKIQYGCIPKPLQSSQKKNNEHELHLSITNDKDNASMIKSLPPTEDAGRGQSPSLVILDEFASYQYANELWSALSFTLSAGGIIVIISTPKGIGNLYHQFWVETSKTFSMMLNKGIGDDEDDEISNPDEEVHSTNFKPFVVHWSQLPLSEFERRGQLSALDWYQHMKAYFTKEGGEQKVAQELDLEFLSSGNTLLSGQILKKLETRTAERQFREYIKSDQYDGLRLFKEPEENATYLIGVDTASGIGQDYSCFYIMKVPNFGDTPELCGEYYNNKVSPKKYGRIVEQIGRLYNEAYLNVEKNNHGISLLEYLEDVYPENKVLNTFKPNKQEQNVFDKNQKGWDTQLNTKVYMLDLLEEIIRTHINTIMVTKIFYEESKTFVNRGKKYEAIKGYTDDSVIAYSLTLAGIHILPKYLRWAREYGDMGADIPVDGIISSSTIYEDVANIKNKDDKNKKQIPEYGLMLSKDEVKKYGLEGMKKEEFEVSQKSQELIDKHNMFSKVKIEEPDDEEYVF